MPPSLSRRQIATVDHSQLRLYCDATGEIGAIYRDVSAAIEAGYRDIPAPPAFAFCLGMDVEPLLVPLIEFGLNPASTLHAEQSFRFHRPLCAGDTVEIETSLEEIFTRKEGALRFARLNRVLRDAKSGEVFTEQVILLVEVREDA